MSDELVHTTMTLLRSLGSDVERHVFLANLQKTNQDLYYLTLINNVEECLPLVYTPVVGYACEHFHHLFHNDSRVLTISIRDKGRIRQKLREWPKTDVRCIVVSDGERILGLGDLGVSGAGIPIGKLALYSACGGVPPQYALPIILDVGTKREDFREDPLYPGIREPRVTGSEYYEFMEEFMVACDEIYDHPVIQHEDFGNTTAFKLLQKYRGRMCAWNDDIQGTASVVLAGIIASSRLTGKKLSQHKFLFLGAGEAGAGIAELLAAAISAESNVSREEARKQCFLIDSKGLVTKHSPNLKHHKIPFAHDHEPIAAVHGVLACVKAIKPTAIIGVAALPAGAFTREILVEMGQMNERPIIFALSNPTSKAECTALEAYEATQGRAIYASGSPFDPVDYNGKHFIPGQGNNSFIFPGLSLGVVFAGIQRVTDSMLLNAAAAVAKSVTQEHLAASLVYPRISEIRDVALNVAVEVVKLGVADGTTRRPDIPKDDAKLRQEIMHFMYQPTSTSSKL